jgi:hypothetical protein
MTTPFAFVLIVCFASSPIDCRDVPVRDRADWCARIDDARARGDLFDAIVVRIDRRFPLSRESQPRGCP